MQSLLKAKITDVKVVNNKTYTILAEPAKDEYSQPSIFKVQSDYGLGGTGDVVSLKIDFTGYIKYKPYNDSKTGEKKIYEDQILYLNAVPHQPIQQNK
jgi:hypothetical protein